MNKYEEWINKLGLYIPTLASGKCIEFTILMKQNFPELIIKKGVIWSSENKDNYDKDNYKEYPHAWCETPQGEIIDPTISQFCLLGKLEYKELDVSKPILKCMGCGKYTYGINRYCEKCLEQNNF